VLLQPTTPAEAVHFFVPGVSYPLLKIYYAADLLAMLQLYWPLLMCNIVSCNVLPIFNQTSTVLITSTQAGYVYGTVAAFFPLNKPRSSLF
jgi:hypothetical protein